MDEKQKQRMDAVAEWLGRFQSLGMPESFIEVNVRMEIRYRDGDSLDLAFGICPLNASATIN